MSILPPHGLAAVSMFVVTAAATALVWKVVPRFGLLAHPNERSSHAKPTPSGGGLGFVVPMVAWFALAASDYAPALALAIAGTAVAALGLLDDIRDIRRDLRLVCHFALAAGCVLWLLEPGVLVAGALILGLAWWLNLYNFMDGIDGIAASQTAAYAAAALALGSLDQSETFAWVLLAASLGFLCFNWAPAKVFMGDVGSGFLGLATGVFALWLWRSGELPFVASAILLLAFWFDASYTLFVRIVTGQAFADAHRMHLYQIVSRRLGHGLTTALFWLHMLMWLTPLAGAAAAFPQWQFACLTVACLPVAIACVVLRAGARDAG